MKISNFESLNLGGTFYIAVEMRVTGFYLSNCEMKSQQSQHWYRCPQPPRLPHPMDLASCQAGLELSVWYRQSISCSLPASVSKQLESQAWTTMSSPYLKPPDWCQCDSFLRFLRQKLTLEPRLAWNLCDPCHPVTRGFSTARITCVCHHSQWLVF